MFIHENSSFIIVFLRMLVKNTGRPHTSSSAVPYLGKSFVVAVPGSTSKYGTPPLSSSEMKYGIPSSPTGYGVNDAGLI